MKKRKIIQILVSVVMILSVSAMAFTANAMLCYKYTYGANENNTIQTTASVQANPNQIRTAFQNAFATHRADPLSNSVNGDLVQLSITVTAYKYNSVTQTLYQSGYVALGSNNPYINFEDFGYNGYEFPEGEFVYQLVGEYEAYYVNTGEKWYTPTITLNPEDVH